MESCFETMGKAQQFYDTDRHMKIKKPEIRGILRTLEDARIRVDEAGPLAGRKQLLLEGAYDLILEVEEKLRGGKRGSRKRGS